MKRRYYRIRRILRRRGPRFHRRRFCELHGQRVWVTTRARRSKHGAVFCSRECKEMRAHPTKEVREWRRQKYAPKCPRPDKRAFVTEAECRESFRTLLSYDVDLQPYQCKCKAWHVGHRSRGQTVGGALDAETRDALTRLVAESDGGHVA